MILEKSIQQIKKKIEGNIPCLGILLTTDFLKKLVSEIKHPIFIPYKEIPIIKNFYGNFVFGEIEGKNVIFLIEEPSKKQKINYLPILLCKNLGIDKMILVTISSGVNPNYKIGDIMLIKDHINLLPEKVNVKKLLKDKLFGIEHPYDKEINKIIENIAMNQNVIIQKGTYVAASYPNYKTCAEYSMIRSIGGDSVGENIITDIIISNYMNLKIVAMSIIISEINEKEKILCKKMNISSFENDEMKKSLFSLKLIIKEFIKKNC